MPKLGEPKRGDIWYVSLQLDTPGEEGGTRPAIVIALHKQTEIAVVIPLTKQQTATHFSLTLKIPKEPTNGLDMDSIALIFQIKAISTSRFITRFGTIHVSLMQQIDILLKEYLNLN